MREVVLLAKPEGETKKLLLSQGVAKGMDGSVFETQP